MDAVNSFSAYGETEREGESGEAPILEPQF